MCTCSCSKKKQLTDTQRLKIYKSLQYFNFLKYFEILTVVQTTNTLPTAVHLMRKLLLALTSSDYRQITGSDSVKKKTGPQGNELILQQFSAGFLVDDGVLFFPFSFAFSYFVSHASAPRAEAREDVATKPGSLQQFCVWHMMDQWACLYKEFPKCLRPTFSFHH